MPNRNRESGHAFRADVWRRTIRDHPSLSPKARLLGHTLSSYMQGDGSRCFPSNALVMRNMGTKSVCTLDNARRELVDAGLLHVRRGGGKRSNMYVPLMPTEHDVEPDATSPALLPREGSKHAAALPAENQALLPREGSPPPTRKEEVKEGAQEEVKDNLDEGVVDGALSRSAGAARSLSSEGDVVAAFDALVKEGLATWVA
jgi:hypothetical protein